MFRSHAPTDYCETQPKQRGADDATGLKLRLIVLRLLRQALLERTEVIEDLFAGANVIINKLRENRWMIDKRVLKN